MTCLLLALVFFLVGNHAEAKNGLWAAAVFLVIGLIPNGHEKEDRLKRIEEKLDKILDRMK